MNGSVFKTLDSEGTRRACDGESCEWEASVNLQPTLSNCNSLCSSRLASIPPPLNNDRNFIISPAIFIRTHRSSPVFPRSLASADEFLCLRFVYNAVKMTELADALSDLQALKKLYGLLLNRDDVRGRESFGNLDDKSRILLKKLLDRAAETALDGRKTSTPWNSASSSVGCPRDEKSQMERNPPSPMQLFSFGIEERSKGEGGVGIQQKKIKTGWCESRKEQAEVSSSSTARGYSKRDGGERKGRPENRDQLNQDYCSPPCRRHYGKLPERRGKPGEESDTRRTETIGFRPVWIASECSKALPSQLQRFHGATPLVRELCLKRSRSTKTEVSEQDGRGAGVAVENQKQRDTTTSFSRGDSTLKKSIADHGKAPRLGKERVVRDTLAFHGCNRFVNGDRAQSGDEGVYNGRQMRKSIPQSQGTKESKNRNATKAFPQPPIRTVAPKPQKDTTSDRISSRITKPNLVMEEANRARFDHSSSRITGEINSSAATQMRKSRQMKAESDAVLESQLSASGSCTKCNRPRRADLAFQKQREKAPQGGRNSDSLPQLIAASKSNPRRKFNVTEAEKKAILVRDVEKRQQKQNFQGQIRKKKVQENPIDGENSTMINRSCLPQQGKNRRRTSRIHETKRLSAKEEAWIGTNSDSLYLETSSGASTDSSPSPSTSSYSCSLSRTSSATTTTTTTSESSRNAKLVKNAKSRIFPTRPYIGPTFLSRNKTLHPLRTASINHRAVQRRRHSAGSSSSSFSSSSSSPSTYSPRTSVRRRLQEAKPVRKPERPGRLKRLKNKLSVIFHHHHHHHHHHHRTDSDSDSDSESCAPPPDGRPNGSFWRNIRRALHRKPEPDKMPAEDEYYYGERGARAVGNPARRPEHHGYFTSLVNAFLRHVWRRSRKRGGNAALNYQKSLRKIGESLRTGKEKKVGLWQSLQRRGGVKLEKRKKPRIGMAARRSSHKKS
ncbi:hypothetical protein H6P81_005782 [Aristolochia fimbriata]|uniref:Uncharacterized protein n=1 Tax=Aristolochia fimbriata TaxID=158543 RepID=A0AAV7EVX9_ARIFI|nr:hypothetical protein H6P81_005782 [Aristolochia fimbriata]